MCNKLLKNNKKFALNNALMHKTTIIITKIKLLIKIMIIFIIYLLKLRRELKI